ncbi:MAG: hypothetical protein A2W11_12140 [Ignavibacteria bacterium RBG_16_35_7]|nr:MAG: hypothetical protein A2W11_12140 [Ignavibacteria bacterium RBG_16_35_7]
MDKEKNKMMINEQDIFTYVFFPEKLSVGKKQIIAFDKTLEEAIEFYTHLKQNSESETSYSLKKKIAEKIPVYKLADVVELFPMADLQPLNHNGNRMAASIKELTPQMTTKTFVDNDKDYLIKVLNYENETKVFVFSTKDEVVKNFDIVIEPKNLTFHLEDNSEPLIIDHSIDAEKIQLKFDN